MSSRSSNHAMNLFVRMDMVEPGDVLLTRSKSLEGISIAAATAGPFSHAALWHPILRRGIAGVTPDEMSSMLVESNDWGIGPATLKFLAVKLKNGQNVLVAKLHDASVAGLFRHPDTKKKSAECLLAAADALQQTEFYLAYSHLSRLANCVSPFIRPIIYSYLKQKEVTDEWIVNGAFCSELVAKFFTLLDLPLFDKYFEPDSISPNKLARSYLRPVTDAIIFESDFDPSPWIDAPQPTMPEAEWIARSRSALAGLVAFNSQRMILKEKVDAFHLDAKAAIVRQRAMVLESYGTVLRTVRQSISIAQEDGDETSLAKFNSYYDQMLFIHALVSEQVRREEADGDPQTSDRVMQTIDDMTAKLFRDVSSRIIRSQALMAVRKIHCALARPSAEKVVDKLRSNRRFILIQWAKQRRNPIEEKLLDELKVFASSSLQPAKPEDIIEFVLAAMRKRPEYD